MRQLGAEIEGGCSNTPPPSGRGKSGVPSGRGLKVVCLVKYILNFHLKSVEHIFLSRMVPLFLLNSNYMARNLKTHNTIMKEAEEASTNGGIVLCHC